MGCRRCGHRRCAVRLSEQESGDKLVQWTVGATECAGGFPHWRERNHGCTCVPGLAIGEVRALLNPHVGSGERGVSPGSPRAVDRGGHRLGGWGPGRGLAPAGGGTRRTLLIAPTPPGLRPPPPPPRGAGAVCGDTRGKPCPGRDGFVLGRGLPPYALTFSMEIREDTVSNSGDERRFRALLVGLRSIVHPLGKRS